MKRTPYPIPRRQFLRSLMAASSATWLSACTEDTPPERYTLEDQNALSEQQAADRALSGGSRFGVHRYTGYRGLANLPWFSLDTNNELICHDERVPRAIDIHCHLGMSLLFRPYLDLNREWPRTQHLLDCDHPQQPCELDLDVYANGNFSPQALDDLHAEIRAQGLWGSRAARTQTIPNLISEMDRMRVDQAILLPIKVGFWFGDNLTEQWRDSVLKAEMEHRLRVGFSVDPHSSSRIEDFDNQVARGGRIVKLHPTVQRFFPDDPKVMEIYQRARELGVIVFFHGGRAGIEPISNQPYALPRHYAKALKDFPEVQFILGHAGARDHDGMLELALRHDNAWIGIHGQSLRNLDNMINLTGGRQLLFGTDWPFYHIGMSLAKVLIVTDSESRLAVRHAILRGNATRLFSHISKMA
jgi:predicted TIM-barrel fold metal-dependent hydrolase